MKSSKTSVQVSATIMCAVLYAVGCYITSYIVSPWGVGQFRPAIVIPSLFAVVFGPWPAGVGAAIGTFIADSANQGGFHLGSLIAAVPGNYIGFYLMGWYLQKKFNWTRYIKAGIVSLIVANLIVAVLYVEVYMNLFLGQLPGLSLGGLTAFILGLTVWWFVTMLPFAVLVTPPLIRAVANALPYIVSEDVRAAALTDVPDRSLVLSLITPGVLMCVVGLVVSFTGVGAQLEVLFGGSARDLIEVMSYASGVILTALGGVFYLRLKKS